MLIDTHAHLYWDSYKDDLDQVLQRSQEAGIETIINIGVDIGSCNRAIQQSKEIKSPKIYCQIGIHPHEAQNYVSTSKVETQNLEKDIKQLEKLYLENKDVVIGIGECGLDYYIDQEFIPPGSSKKEIITLQKKLLIAQINLAKKLNLPLSIHCRDDRSPGADGPPISAWSEVFDYLKDTAGILHCYSGLPEHTKLALQTNYLISFAGNITYPKNGYLHQAVKDIPLDRIVLETDCPFLAPQPIRGQRNEPASVKEIAEFIAGIKEVSFAEITTQTTQNFKKLFNLL